jgi:hypothetical protein
MAPGSDRRQIVWSQGQILPPEAALAVQMIEAEKAATHFPIVISHDCDLAAALAGHAQRRWEAHGKPCRVP